MQVWRMRTGISITLKPADRRRLKVLTRNRNTPHKHVWRAEIVLLSADGVGTNEIKRRTGKSKTCVWRWQDRFMQTGYDSLLRDKTRPSRLPPVGGGFRDGFWGAHRARPARRGDPLDCYYDGESRRYQREFRPTHLAHAWSPAAPGPPVQAFQRPEVHRQAARCCRAPPPAHSSSRSQKSRNSRRATPPTPPCR